MSKINNLFTYLFDVSNGYIYKENILFLKDNSFIECFDSNKLAYILNNLDEIEKNYRKDANNQVSLSKYYQFSLNGLKQTIYHQNKNGLYGRYIANNSLSGQGMVREARHVIFQEFYKDIDIDNCHPVIISWICSNLNIDCPNLKTYICDREKIIKDLIKLNPNCDREHFKKAFLKVNYGCGKDAYNQLFKNKTKFVEDFRNEILELQEKLSKIFFKFLEINTELRNKKDKTYNYYGSTLSHICQFVENQILILILEFLKSKQIDIQNSILCFDGLMLNKDFYNDSLLFELKKYFEDMDIYLNFSVKEMNLAESILNLCKYNEKKQYKFIPKYKQQFLEDKENYYFKDFIKDLINNNKTWDLSELHKFFIENVNRVMFIILKQKNSLFGRFSDNKFQILDTTEHKIEYWSKDKKKDELIAKRITFKQLTLELYNYIKVYDDLDFIPYTIDDKPTIINNNNFNMFRGFKATLLDKDKINKSLIEPILKHIGIVLCKSDIENYKYIMSYFHRIFKYPSRKTQIIMVFKSAQGAGKGFIFNKFIGDLVFGDLLYRFNTGLDFINERFNMDQAGSLLTICEEISTADDSYKSTFDKLKSMCCDEYGNYELKFGAKTRIRNFTNYIFNTNHNFPVKIEHSDRRFAVFECSDKYINDYNYFKHLHNYLTQEVADHFYSYVYHMSDEEALDPRYPPKNEFYRSIQYNSLHNSIRFLYNLYKFNFEVEYDYDSWECLYIEYFDKDKKLIKSGHLNIIYKKWCVFNNETITSMSKFKNYTAEFIKIKRSNYIYYDIGSLNFSVDYFN
jgi:hypothetical protein